MSLSNLIGTIDWSGSLEQAIGTISGQAAFQGVYGQYFFLFMLEGATNFLGDAGIIHTFVMEEKMGGDVPVFKFVFSTLDKSIITKLHEGARVSCRYGRTMLESKSAELMIQSFKYNDGESTGYIKVELSGFVQQSQRYLREPKQKAFRFTTSKEAIIETAREHFVVEDRTSEETDDEQTWLRMNTPAVRFIYDTWKNSYISDDNFLIIGIDFHRRFIITDLKAMLSKPVKWVLQAEYDGPQPNTASYNPNVKMSSDFGLLNQLTIYAKQKPVHSIVNDKTELVVTPGRKASYISGNPNITSEEPVKTEVQTMYDHTNVHKNKHKAVLNNRTKNGLQNSVELAITIENKWQDYELFDLVMYHPPKIQGVPEGLERTMGGVYAITRISRYFANNRCCTEVTISRDGISGLEGGMLGSWGSDFLSNIASNILGGIWDAIF